MNSTAVLVGSDKRGEQLSTAHFFASISGKMAGADNEKLTTLPSLAAAKSLGTKKR